MRSFRCTEFRTSRAPSDLNEADLIKCQIWTIFVRWYNFHLGATNVLLLVVVAVAVALYFACVILTNATTTRQTTHNINKSKCVPLALAAAVWVRFVNANDQRWRASALWHSTMQFPQSVQVLQFRVQFRFSSWFRRRQGKHKTVSSICIFHNLWFFWSFVAFLFSISQF